MFELPSEKGSIQKRKSVLPWENFSLGTDPFLEVSWHEKEMFLGFFSRNDVLPPQGPPFQTCQMRHMELVLYFPIVW